LFSGINPPIHSKWHNAKRHLEALLLIPLVLSVVSSVQYEPHTYTHTHLFGHTPAKFDEYHNLYSKYYTLTNPNTDILSSLGVKGIEVATSISPPADLATFVCCAHFFIAHL
jgi:hypothetical protein